MKDIETAKRASPALHGWAGLALVSVCWPLNWALPGRRTAYLFFPLWLGYVLIVDALVLWRTGTSIWSRSRRGFAWLFVISAPAWWVFELINRRTGNWEYLGGNTFTHLQYYLLCTVSFSTVMPAVFETAELARTFRWVERCTADRPVHSGAALRPAMLACGLATFSFTMGWPRYFYPFVWISLLLILEPLNGWLGPPCLTESLRRGDWRTIVSLSVGALSCGFLWEMWNYYSYPKWFYHTPGVQFLHVFQMPLLGYGGYIPFGLELWAMKNFLSPRWPELRV